MRYSLFIFGVLGAAACSDGGGTMLPDGGGEEDTGATQDNCVPDMPCALTDGVMGSDFIAPAMDEDKWTISVPAAGRIMQVVVSNDADFSPIRLEVALLDPNGVSKDTASFNGNGKQRITMQLIAALAGTYTVVVRDSGNDTADRRNPYFVLVTLLPESDQNEPNNTPATATALTPGTLISGTIGVQGDEDWFAFDVPANQLVLVSLQFPARTDTMGVKLKYVLWDPMAMDPIAESTEPGGNVTELRENRAVANLPGRYLIQVVDETGTHADLMRTYALTVTLAAEPDVQDLAAPNNDPMTPTMVMSGQAVTAYIASTADEDWYDIRVRTAPALITVEAAMDPTSAVDLSFTVFNLDGTTQICDGEDQCKAFRFVPESAPMRPNSLKTSHVARVAGRYLVQVRDFQSNEYDTAKPYTITISTPNEPDPFETYDDSQAMARLIPAATSTRATSITYQWAEGNISYANDVDWYAFAIPGPMGAAAGQNGDWLIQLDVETQPTPIELQLFMYAVNRDYGGYGAQCGMPAPGDPDPTMLACQFPDAQNAMTQSYGENFGDCIVFFRETTSQGLHFVRITDLNRDDYDLNTRYRFRLTLTAHCPAGSLCMGRYLDNGMDLCGRP